MALIKLIVFVVVLAMVYTLAVYYKNTAPLHTNNLNECVVSGCSEQICAEEEMTTTCEFFPEYACYRSAECARQIDGRCGWTQTAQLNRCLDNARLPSETTAPF